MRSALLVLSLAACLSAVRSARAADEQPDAKKVLQAYTVTIIEFQLKNADASMSAATVAEGFEKLSTGGNVSLVETVRLTALEGYQASATFGKTVSIVQGVTVGVNGKSKNMVQRQIGTTVKVTAESRNDKVLMKLNYQASRITGELKEDSAPDVSTIDIDTNLLLKIGSRTVVAGTTDSSTTFLLVTVTQ